MSLSIETERLIIRRFEQRDMDDQLEYLSDPEIARYEYWYPYTADDLAEESVQPDPVPGTEGQWFELAVELKSEQKVIGNISIKVLSK